jgi:hypothetical protein
MELSPMRTRVGGSDAAAAATEQSSDNKWEQVNPLAELGIKTTSKHPFSALELQEMCRRQGSTDFGEHGVGGEVGSSRSDSCMDPPPDSSLPQPLEEGITADGAIAAVRPSTGHTSRAPSSSVNILRLRAASSSIAESLNPVNITRRTRAWCRAEGKTGTFFVIVLCATIVGLFIVIVLHCTPILDMLQGRPGIRKMLKVDTRVSVAVGIIGSILMLKLASSLVAITCQHDATHERVGTQIRQQKRSAWRVMRAWDLFKLYTTPGGRYFDVWEYVREVFESVLQMIAVAEYAENGVGKDFLIGYTLIVAINSFGVILLMLPKLAPSRWNNVAPEKRATLERSVLLLDVVCDALCTSGGVCV